MRLLVNAVSMSFWKPKDREDSKAVESYGAHTEKTAWEQMQREAEIWLPMCGNYFFL